MPVKLSKLLVSQPSENSLNWDSLGSSRSDKVRVSRIYYPCLFLIEKSFVIKVEFSSRDFSLEIFTFV